MEAMSAVERRRLKGKSCREYKFRGQSRVVEARTKKNKKPNKHRRAPTSIIALLRKVLTMMSGRIPHWLAFGGAEHPDPQKNIYATTAFRGCYLYDRVTLRNER